MPVILDKINRTLEIQDLKDAIEEMERALKTS
jgi:hypothetical protein